jgi:hypothetical protein
MKRAQRMLAATIGVAAIALGAVALAAPAAAAPSSPSSPSSPSNPTGPSGSPSSSPSSPGAHEPSGPSAPVPPGARPSRPAVSPSTSDSAPAGKAPAAPKTVGYDMSVAASDVTFESDGPTHGTTANVSISVRNNGSAPQRGLTVTVLEPSDAHLVGIRPDATGIDDCVHGTATDGRGTITCQVHDAGPGHQEMASFGLTGDVPLPADAAHPNGSVILHGFHTPNAHPADTSVSFAVHALDTSEPAQQIDLRVTAGDVTMRRGSDGRYHGTVLVDVSNRGGATLPAITLEVLPPSNVTLDGPSDDGFPYPCVRISGDDVLHNLHRQSGLRCSMGAIQAGGSFRTGFALSSGAASSGAVPGQVSVYPESTGIVYDDPNHLNAAGFHVTFASPAPSGNGRAAGSGSSLPVTGTPLALIAGGGAAVLAAGGVLLVLARRRIRVTGQSPKI